MPSVQLCRYAYRSLIYAQVRFTSLLRANLLRDTGIHQLSCTVRDVQCSNCVAFSTRHLLRTPTKAVKSQSTKTADIKQTDAAIPRPIPKITLHESDGRIIGIMTKSEAQRVARQRNLKLVLLQNSGTNKEMYKLLTGDELHEERMKERRLKQDQQPEERDSKTLTLSSKISSHDIETRLKAIKKWLKKNHSVLITVLGSPKDASSNSNVEEITKTIESGVTGIGQLQQKRLKDNNMKFTIKPIKTEEQEF